MKLKTHVFIIANFEGKSINIEGRQVRLKFNEALLETGIFDIFRELEFDDDEISGNSLLSYYKVMEDGSLQVKGSKIQFWDVATDKPILVKKIKRSSVHDDENIPVELIKKFIEYFNVEEPENVFIDLNDEEKTSIISDRSQAAASASKAASDEEAQKAADEAARIKKEADELKASLKPEFVIEKGKYASHQSYYREIGFKEYIKEPYHLFYGKDDNEGPNVLIERASDWMQEVEAVEIVEENDKTLLVEFKDKETAVQIALDIDSGEITVNPDSHKE